jgi:ABC-type multidrug transport system ATPase subunit
LPAGRNGQAKPPPADPAGLLKPETPVCLAEQSANRYAESHARSNIGLVMHQPFLYEHLTGVENLRFYARLYQLADDVTALEAALAQGGCSASPVNRSEPIHAA